MLGGTMKTTDYAKLLRHLGVALLFAPEPLSTPLGVAFILVARHLSRKLEATQNAHLREMVKHYLAHSGLLATEADVALGVPSSPQGPIVSEEPPILGQITGSLDFQGKPPVRQGKRIIPEGITTHAAAIQGPSRLHEPSHGLCDAAARTQKVTYHRIDMERLSRRYGRARRPVAQSGQARTSAASHGAIVRRPAAGPISTRPETERVGQLRATSRTMNGEIVQRRDRTAARYTTVADALHRNNYYYEMLSRANVIGGY